MSRKELDVKIETEGRDFGKVFHITEMPTAQAEKWGIRALLGMAKSGLDVSPDVVATGMAGVNAMGIKALLGIDWAILEPLLDEMFTCVKIKPDASNGDIIRPLIEQDIEEVSTRIKLRMSTLNLHLDFLQAVMQSISASVTAQAAPVKSSTRTYRKRSQ